MASAISGETLNKAMKELGEIPEKRMEFIRALRVRLEQWVPNPHDPDEERLVLRRIDDDKFLLCFLRARKFDVERASILFVNYYKYRLKYASLMSELTPEAVEPLLKENLLYVLPQRSQDGCKALVGKFVKFNIEGGKPLAELLSMILVVLDKLIEDEETQVHGMMFCQDLSDLTLIKVMALVGKEQFKKGMLIKLIQVCGGLMYCAWYNCIKYNITIFILLNTLGCLSCKIQRISCYKSALVCQHYSKDCQTLHEAEDKGSGKFQAM